MKNNRIILVTLLVTSFLLYFPIFDSECTSAETDELVRIHSVSPFGDKEWISLFNYGPGDVDLEGFYISDGEGEIRFEEKFIIRSGSEIVLITKSPKSVDLSTTKTEYRPGSHGISGSGNFIMADVGDDIHLFREERLVDTVCYRSAPAAEGWSGDTVPIPAGMHILRIGIADTDTSQDWISTRPGFTDMPFEPDTSFHSSVTPFTFPESGGEPIYREIENAKKSVKIAIYQLTSPNLVSLLCKLESDKENHVDVSVTLEGNALGYDMSRELSLMKSLADAGGDVRIINDPLPGNYERYSYFHNKYAIVDDRKVMITSENWTESNMSSGTSNRGWGAIIDSTEYARYMDSIFEKDRDTGYGDVSPLEEYYPDLKPYRGDLTYEAPGYLYETKMFEAEITPILSPDNSYGALKRYMEESTERIYSEQLDLGSSFSNLNPESPVTWMISAAKRGVDSRFILDSSTGDDSNHTKEVKLINATTDVKAITISGGDGFGTMHNKGIIIDDGVWLGSVNWTENSFHRNREAAVMMESQEVADYFLFYFLEDWGVNDHTLEEDGLIVTSDLENIHEGSYAVFRVSGPEGRTYTWDVYGDGNTRSSDIPMIVCSDMKAGTYKLSVNVEETHFSTEYQFVVEETEEIPMNGADSSEIAMVTAALIAVVSGSGYALFRKRHYKADR